MPSRQVDYALAAASGFLLALSFPRFGNPAFAWVALAPILTALTRVPDRLDRGRQGLSHALVLGLITGCIYFAGTLYWVGGVMTVYGGVSPWAAWPVAAALVAYMALFPALFAVVMARLVRSYGSIGIAAAPFVWVATELGRTHLFGGFPWVLLGYSQTPVLLVAQAASIFGVFGLSGLVSAVSAAAVVSAAPTAGRWRFVPAVVVAGVALSASWWGQARIARGSLTSTGDVVRVGLVQGNVDQAEKWDPARAASIFDEYLRLTNQAAEAGARLILWPESSTPFSYDEDPVDADRIRAIARRSGASILVGSDQVVQDAETRYYNAAYLVQPDGRTGGIYQKMHLVPFGEYVPLKHLLFFAAPLVQAVSDFSPGDRPVLLKTDGHQFSTAICYEIVYPALVRRFVTEGSELLTTITNDAWFGRTSAPYQHFEQASMRAIENGRFLIRAANTGISGIVDPYGRVIAESRLFETTVVTGDVRFLTTSTFYTRHGDVFAYASVALTLALFLAAMRRPKEQR